METPIAIRAFCAGIPKQLTHSLTAPVKPLFPFEDTMSLCASLPIPSSPPTRSSLGKLPPNVSGSQLAQDCPSLPTTLPFSTPSFQLDFLSTAPYTPLSPDQITFSDLPHHLYGDQPPRTVISIENIVACRDTIANPDYLAHPWWVKYQHMSSRSYEGFICHAHVYHHHQCCVSTGQEPGKFCPDHYAQFRLHPRDSEQDFNRNPVVSHIQFPSLIDSYLGDMVELYPMNEFSHSTNIRLHRICMEEQRELECSPVTPPNNTPHPPLTTQGIPMVSQHTPTQYQISTHSAPSTTIVTPPVPQLLQPTTPRLDERRLRCTCRHQNSDNVYIHQAHCPMIYPHISIDAVPPEYVTYSPINV